MRHRHTSTARTLVLAAALGTIGLLVAWSEGGMPVARAHHTAAEIEAYRGSGIGLVNGENNFFLASGNCYGCHGIDTTGAVWANHTPDGRDVNVPDAWRSTMMGNSARDPFWRAKVSHEVAVNPGHQTGIEDKCTACHAPLGRHDKFLSGDGPYSILELTQQPIAQDGVSCLACHMQSPDSIGLFFSGDVKFDTTNRIYGPYDEVFTGAMESFLNRTPMFGAHVLDGGLCAGCHTLINGTIDMEGEPTGTYFVEQATYHEWVNSAYNPDNGSPNATSCQGCHMPRITDAVVIAGLYDWLTPRTPFGLHELAGGNVFMLNLLKENKEALYLTAGSVHFDSTIARTYRMLQQHSLLLEASVPARDPDTAFIDVKLTNLTGHKFPSGYPSRRAFIELVVLNAAGDTVFQSGRHDGAYEVIGHDAEWEPHHDVIRTPDQAQIYEMVMADVNGDKTTVLMRAKGSLKDNRLVPLGFSTGHFAYDTTLVVGVPPQDIDFNHNASGEEGSGTDITHYHVPMNGYTGLLTISARVWYQSAPPRWMEEMFALSTPEIETFRPMYEQADGTPVLVKEVSIVDLTNGIDDPTELGVRIFPNPVRDGSLRIEGLDDRVTAVEVFDMNGGLIARETPRGLLEMRLALPATSATYIVVIHAVGRRFVERIVAF